MFHINLKIVVIFWCGIPQFFSQQIFDTVDYSTCKYINKDDPQKYLEFTNKIWTIQSLGRQRLRKLPFSLCGDVPIKGCDPRASACILDERNPKNSILNAGEYFIYTTDDNDREVLQSVNGQKCTDNENFTVVIQTDCRNNMKITPTYLFEDECILRIEMMNPNCLPLCTFKIKENLVDLRPLQKLESLTINEPNINKTFSISMCKANPKCGHSVSACEILAGGNSAPIFDITSHISYKWDDNRLIVKGHHGSSRNKKMFEFHIKCNWYVDGISNARYLVPKTQGRTYKFEAESSMACIKFPMDCKVIDTQNSFLYDLSNLNKMNGWEIGNVSYGVIYINVCGPLQLSLMNNECRDHHSQVCYINGTNLQYNLGSIPTDLRITSKNTINGFFMEGSVCSTNASKTYSTDLEFICSALEKGPMLQSIINCTFMVKWETPAACPKHFATGDNCVIQMISGRKDLNKLHGNLDRIQNLTPNSYLRYNLCGVLHNLCDNKTDSAVCYHSNGRERSVGFSNKILTQNDTTLSLTLNSDTCDSLINSKTTIFFNCNSHVREEGVVTLKIIRDGCIFELYIDTPLACVSTTFVDCKIYNSDSVFDLNMLVRNDSNYLIRSSSSAYKLNVCRTLFMDRDASLCPQDSAGCIINLNMPHLKNRYESLGRIYQNTHPVSVTDGRLTINYEHGSYCLEAESLSKSFSIQFECFDREEGPQLLKQDNCKHTFSWRTPHACPKKMLSIHKRSTKINCPFIHSSEGYLVDLANIDAVYELRIPDRSILRFSLCENNYTKCSSNGTSCDVYESEIELLNNSEGPYFLFHLENRCDNNSVNQLHIQWRCGSLNNALNIANISGCVINLNLNTVQSCPVKVTTIDLQNLHVQQQEVHENTSPTNSKTTKSVIASNENPIQSTKITQVNYTKIDCPIRNGEASLEFNLMNIEPFNVTSKLGNNYTISLSQPSRSCLGYICKNGSPLLKNGNCPNVQLDTSNSLVKLPYESEQACDEGRYRLEVWLKCNSTYEIPRVTTDLNCHFVVIYPVKEICYLLNSQSITISSFNTGAAVGSSIAFLALAALGGYFILTKNSSNFKICGYKRASKVHVRCYYKNLEN